MQPDIKVGRIERAGGDDRRSLRESRGNVGWIPGSL